MSKIATYSLADSPLQLSDRLIGTEAARPIPSPTPLATKNFSLGELLQLFSSNFPAATLQAVLDAGNIATQDITLTGTIYVDLIKPTNIEDMLGSQGTTFQILSKAIGGFNWVDPPISITLTTIGSSGASTIIGGVLNIPIYTGGIDTIPTLQQVLEEGGNSALDEQIVLRNGSVISPSSQSVWNALGIGIETGNKQSYLPAGELILVDTGGGGIIQLNATDKTLRIQDATIRTDLLNGTDRTYQLPDADGTIALTGDIPTVGNWGALNYPTWLAGTPFVKMTADGAFALDTNTYLTGITSLDVTTALGFTPYNETNPSGYTNNLGTVTSVAELTIGTTGTDVSSSVVNGTTTPVITFNLPTASATNRGALSSTDWTSFNGRKKKVISDTVSVTVTGTTSLTLVKTYEMPSGTLYATGFLDLYMLSTRTGTSAIHTMGLYINTTNNFATATLVSSIATGGNFTPIMPYKATFVLKSNLLIGGVSSQTTGTNYPYSVTQTSVACNNTVSSVWFFVGVTPANSGQTINFQAIEMTT